MSNKPVAIEYLLTDSVSPGLNKIEGAATSVGKTFARASNDIKARLKEQRDVVKHVENDLKGLEQKLKKAAPGGQWLNMSAEVEACNKVLNEEKAVLDGIEKEYLEAAQTGTRLTMVQRDMTDALAKMRLEGKQGTPEYEELTNELAELSSVLTNMRAETKHLSDNNAGLRGFASGVTGAAGAVATATGVIGMFTKNNEDLVKVQTKVQSVLAITMGLQQMMNVLNKDSAFRLVTLRKAKDAFAAANNRLAVSLGISTVAAKALMATLTLGLSVAIGAAIALWDRYRSKQVAAKEEAEEFGKKVADSAAKPISAINELSVAWSKLGDNMEAKKKFIEENKKRFDELGISVNSVTDAENLLVANKSKFIEACLARAKALAVQELAVEKYKEVLLSQQKLEATPKAYVWKNGTYTDGYGVQREGRVMQKSREWQRAEDAAATAQKEYDKLIGQQVDFTAREREILASIGANADSVIEGSVAAIEKIIASKRELLKNATDKAEYDRIVKEIEVEEKRLAAITGGTKNNSNSSESSNAGANDISKLQRQLANETAQARIDAMQDGLAKTLAQNALNHKRELEQIEQFGAELLATYQAVNKDITELPETDRTMFAAMTTAVDASYRRADSDAKQAEIDRQQQEAAQLLQEYGSYLEKRAALTEEWEKKIAELPEMYQEKARQQMVADLAALDDEYQQFSQGIIDLFERTSKKSIDELERIAERAEAIFDALKNNDYEAYLKAEGNSGNAMSREQFNVFRNSKRDMDATEEGIANINRKVFESQNAFKRLGTAIKEALNPKGDKKQAFADIGDALGQISDLAASVGDSVGQIFSSFGNDEAAEMVGTLTDMISGVGELGAGIAKIASGDILGGIQGVFSGIAKIASLFKDNEQAYIDAANAAREYNTALKEIGLSERYSLFDTIFGTDGVGKFQEAKEIAIESLQSIEDEVYAIRNRTQTVLGKVYANPIEATYDGRSGWNKFWGSGDHKIKNYYFDINDYINSDGSLKLEELQAWYDAYESGLDSSEKQILQDLIANGTAYEEAIQVMTDHIDQLWGDLASSIADNMIDAFLETGDAAENLGELVDDVARNMAKSMIESLLIKDIFNDDLQTQLLDLLKIGDQTGANALIQDAIESAGELAPIIEGIVTSLGLMSDRASVAQSGKAGAYQTMSQDTGTELKGLFTAMRMGMEDMKVSIDEIGPGLSEATGVLVEIREEVKKSNGWLGKIYERIEKIIRDGLKVE